MQLNDAVAIVTGGGSGIGQGIAIRFAAAGGRVVVADRNLAGAEETAAQIAAAGGAAIAAQMDVTDEAAIANTVTQGVAAFGPVTHLVNNAGLAIGHDTISTTPDEWDLNVDVVLKGAYLCTRAVLPAMIEHHQGNIINIASVNGMFGIGQEAYSAAKAGMINFTQNLAVRHGRDGIRANVIAPGTINTPIWGERVAAEPDVFDKLGRWYPLGRVGSIDDVAKAAVFLASDDAAWITGVLLPVDGGLTAGNYRFTFALNDDDNANG